MSMTEAQAKQLGELISMARMRLGLSVRGLAQQLSLGLRG